MGLQFDLKKLDEYFKMEPPTPIEAEWKDRISVEEFAIHSNRLFLACDEAKEAFARMAISDAVQAQDCIAGIYTAQGDLAVATVGTYLHIMTGQAPIKFILEFYANDPTVGVRDGDIFFVNEPLCGGIHNPDMITAMPVFHAETLIAWVVVAGHETETGASQPGGYVPDARSRYEEGLKSPPIKIGENFQHKKDLLNLLANMVRDDRMIVGDTITRAASCMKLRQRILELVEETSEEFFVGLLRRILEASATAATARVRTLNDGTFRAVIFFDVHGSRQSLAKIAVELEKKAEKITLRITAASPPSPSYMNTRPHIIRAVMIGDMVMYYFNDIPCSTGLLAPFEVEAPEGTCTNPPADVAQTASTRLTPIVINAVHICLAKLFFDSEYRESTATPFGPSGRGLMGVGQNQFGEVVSWATVELANGAGGGARLNQDGVDVAGFYYSGYADSLDVETLEAQFPMLHLYRNFAADQCGLGRFRGGTGSSVAYALHHNQSACTIVYSPCESRFPVSLGLFGGYAGGMAPAISVRPDGDGHTSPSSTYHDLAASSMPGDYTIGSALPTEPFNEGDVVAAIGTCGGGYGDVIERDPQAVIEDVRKGVISHWTARNVFCVEFNSETYRLDAETTEQLRQEERDERKREARPYAEFVREWETKRPPPEALVFYGPWPEAITAQPSDNGRKGSG